VSDDPEDTLVMASHAFVLRPIEPETADRLRHGAVDVYVADAHPGYPCRQCLRDAQVGDELILVSHDPFSTASPYRSASPIFLHREPCQPPIGGGAVPEQLTIRQLSVRSFDGGEMMLDATVIDGALLATTIEHLFADGNAARIHVHNASRGCWAVAVDRA
jgi:hypothetical protein